MVTSIVATGHAGVVRRVLDCEGTTLCLALFGGEIEIIVGWVASPGHHIEKRALQPAKSTGIGEGP